MSETSEPLDIILFLVDFMILTFESTLCRKRNSNVKVKLNDYRLMPVGSPATAEAIAMWPERAVQKAG